MRLTDKIYNSKAFDELYDGINEECKNIINIIMDYAINDKFDEHEQDRRLEEAINYLIEMKRNIELKNTKTLFNIR